MRKNSITLPLPSWCVRVELTKPPKNNPSKVKKMGGIFMDRQGDYVLSSSSASGLWRRAGISRSAPLSRRYA